MGNTVYCLKYILETGNLVRRRRREGFPKSLGPLVIFIACLREKLTTEFRNPVQL